MKDIKYNGNLLEDIIDADNKFNLKDFLSISSIVFVVLAIFINIYLFGLNAISFSIGNLFISTGSLFGIHVLGTLGTYLYKNITISRKGKDASRRLNVLAHDMSVVNDATITKDNIIDAQIDQVYSESKTTGDDGKLISKEEKLTRYFYLLDKEDKIRVLKEIRKIIKERKNTIESSELKLLEDNDIDYKNLPVKKTLTLK